MKKYLRYLLVIPVILLAFAAFIVYWGPTKTDEIVILNYHQVNRRDANPLTVRPGNFEAELDQMLEDGYKTITVDQFLDHMNNGAPLPPKPLMITFDDGYADNYEYAYPLLKARNMTAVIFLVTDYIGTQENYLTWEQVKEMKQNGIEFGSHTLSHEELKSADLKYAEFQLETSQKVFEWRFGHRVRLLAYPCGTYDDAVKKIVKKTGYAAAFTVQYGTVRHGDDMYALQRVPIFGNFADEVERCGLRMNYVHSVALFNSLHVKLEDMGLPFLAQFVPLI